MPERQEIMNKLFKYEIKQTNRLSILLIGLLAIEAIIASLWNIITPLHKLLDNVSFSVVILCGSICAVGVLGIYILGRYYKVLFGNTSSLTMTIPVANKTHLNTNVLMGVMWLLIAVVVITFGLIITDLSMGKGNDIYGVLFIFDIRNWIDYTNDNNIAEAIILGITYIICPIIVIINLYLSGLTILSLTKLIVKKTGVGEANKIIIATSIIALTAKALVFWGIIEIMDRIANMIQSPFVWDLCEILSIDVFYSISAVVMYMFCKWVITKKYES